MTERHVRTIHRWIWSPLEDVPEHGWLPIAREYCLSFHAPQHFPCGYALVHCEMLHDHYLAALEDHRLIVLDDLHSHEVIPACIAIALGPQYRVSLKDTVRQMLVKLAKHHPQYLPEH